MNITEASNEMLCLLLEEVGIEHPGEADVVKEASRRLRLAETWTTYRRADGQPAMGEYAFMVELDCFEEEAFDSDTGTLDVIAETWQLVTSRTITVGEPPEPEEEQCEAPGCEKDAEVRVDPTGADIVLCAEHASAAHSGTSGYPQGGE